jgi:hypothetical protein
VFWLLDILPQQNVQQTCSKVCGREGDFYNSGKEKSIFLADQADYARAAFWLLGILPRQNFGKMYSKVPNINPVV